MHALNLFTLTRADADSADYTGLLNALSGRSSRRQASSQEAQSLCARVNRLASWFTAHPAGDPDTPTAPVITITGSAGTGKTLLLFDLAIALSENRKDVLFLHGGPLREGHLLINRRLRHVAVLSGTDYSPKDTHDAQGTPAHASHDRFAYIMSDEANRLSAGLLSSVLSEAKRSRTPVILAYDPFSIRGLFSPLADAEEIIETQKTHAFAFSGNIRINRPVYSFMRNLFCLKDVTARADYSCIDVLCAGNSCEEQLIADYYAAQGYHQIRLFPDVLPEDELVAQEYGVSAKSG
ncbi:MAG: DUF2075 domain-containing protein [Eubacterium sp.]|nr:DUF2075 domain-containing protein [Eubacterium sp.]